MTYIDAHYDRDRDTVNVVERKNGERIYKNYPAIYSFYYPDNSGTETDLWGNKLTKFQTNTNKVFQRELKANAHRRLYESDIKPLFKVLEENYLDSELPDIHTASLDIEVDFCKDRGYAAPDDPHQPITAISLHLDWLDQLVTLVLPPKALTRDQAQEICSRFDNCILFDTEYDLLDAFYDIIDDIDLVYTWNGEGFDIPYIVNRTALVMGKEHIKRFCLWNKNPNHREFERYGKKQSTYDLIGRLHLDYYQLYKKYTYHEQPSYKLDFIAEYELGENKVQYEGSLDQLYNQDFDKFIEYNRQDVVLLTKLERKLKFIGLTNILAHENCVLFSTTMGSVAITDQALIIEAHRSGRIVHNRRSGLQVSEDGIAGAYVADPVIGITKWIGSVDINSLYPSAIRTLNMSPETLVAQLQPELTDAFIKKQITKNHGFSHAWGDLFGSLEYQAVMEQTDQELKVYFDVEQRTEIMTAKDIYEWVFSSDDLCISSNGTIFRTDVQGIVPRMLEKWYADRKTMQKEMRKYQELADKESDPQKKLEFKKLVDYWNQRQAARKVNLNAAYGALTNPGSKFSDQRIGQSTTLSGRTITKHMNAKVNEVLTGTYNHTGGSIIYADTDSAYFTVSNVLSDFKDQGIEIDKDIFVEISDSIADQINNSFPDFVTQAFNVRKSNDIIKCGREICGVSGLFTSKKRYAILYYDKEGFRFDTDGSPGKMKIMGMDTQRADTPKPIQKFLRELLLDVLQDATEKDVNEKIRLFRKDLKSLEPWEKGIPKSVKKLTDYLAKAKENIARYNRGEKGKATIPGHVQASYNWNALCDMNSDMNSMRIVDGQKVIVCKLKENLLKMNSVALPIDQANIPMWFKLLPFDLEGMENSLIDVKIDNILGVLGWNFSVSKVNENFSSFFVLE